MSVPLPIDLFEPVVSPGKWHPQFAELLGSSLHSSARALMNELNARMGHPNGHFERDFQTHGFHAGVFELACFGYLEEAGFTVDRSCERPDFIISAGGLRAAIEAVTLNPQDGTTPDVSLRRLEQLSDAEIFAKTNVEFPSRIIRSLKKKLRQGYQNLPHCRDIPLVLMIAPYFEAGSGFFTDDALVHPLFGGPIGIRNVVPPFFQQVAARPVSAVVYCNQFTVSRFLRLSVDFGARETPTAFRRGFCCWPIGDENHALGPFEHKLGSPNLPKESWAEGVTVFENPLAAVPLQFGFFPGTSRVFVEDGHVCRTVSAFHPVVSFMQIHSE
jgi:hypothetical protein